MRRVLTLAALVCCSLGLGPAQVVQAAAQKYLNPAFDSLSAGHREIAILPFRVSIDTKRIKNFDPESVRQSAQAEGFEFQQQLYVRLLQKSEIEKYRVSFQDVERSNALLVQAGIPLDSLSFRTKEELAGVLGVDAILSGTIRQSQPTSQGMAMAQTLLLGFHGSTQRVDITVSIHDAATGVLLWTYDHTDSGGGFTGSMANAVEAMVKSLLKKIAGNFPYRTRP